MEQVEERYISLLTDFGFKRIFGSAELCDKVFDRLFEEAEIAKFFSAGNAGVWSQ